jgi:bifunctional DNA-binding transcriptional regulator/antitoxin component of YhaV-PrlF toxin-antitoxin module
MNKRTAKVVQLNESLAVVLPKDWTRGMGVSKGSRVVLFYNGFIRIYAPRVSRSDSASESGGPP